MAMALQQSFDERYELWIGDLDLDKKGTNKRLEHRLNQAISKYSSFAKIVEENENLFNSLKHVFVRVTSERAFLELLKPETQLRFDGSILNIWLHLAQNVTFTLQKTVNLMNRTLIGFMFY